jgi:hypothetical protein
MSIDAFHWWGQDLTLTPGGDISTVDSLPRDDQRVFRRLCTMARSPARGSASIDLWRVDAVVRRSNNRRAAT